MIRIAKWITRTVSRRHGPEILKVSDIAADARRAAPDLLDHRIEFRLAPASHDNRRALERQTLCRRKV